MSGPRTKVSRVEILQTGILEQLYAMDNPPYLIMEPQPLGEESDTVAFHCYFYLGDVDSDTDEIVELIAESLVENLNDEGITNVDVSIRRYEDYHILVDCLLLVLTCPSDYSVDWETVNSCAHQTACDLLDYEE